MPPSVLAISGGGMALHIIEGGPDGAAMVISLADTDRRSQLSVSITAAEAGTLTAFLNRLRLARLEVEAL
jgi:hypothetical protein